MNLGISLETGSASQNSTELGSAASTQTGNAGQAGAVFGQLMAKAMQHHGHGQAQEQANPGGQNEANTALASDASQPCCEPTESGQGQGDAAALAPGHSDDALAQFNALWMSGASHTLTLPATPGVKSVSVGPSIQVITASSPAPDASSLTAFAHQQGLDAQAIAWLMNPHAQTATQAATPGAGSGTLTGAVPGAMPAPGTGALFPPGMLAPARAPTVPDAADSTLNTGALLGSAADPAANPVQTATGLPGTHAPNNAAASATALAAAVPVVQAILSGPDSRKPVPTQAASTNTPTPPELTELSALTMAQLRWGGLKPRGLGQTDTAPSAPATSTATPTLWAQSDLDLSGLGLELGLLTPNSDTPTQNASNTGSPAPTDASAIAGAALGGVSRSDSLASQARSAAASANAMGSTVTSDQMQQLSEKMADAVGERIMREIERGQWNLRLMLKPAHLGHIEVEMRLRAGQLDASFVAPQAATRELLQDGLDKLRQQLDQAGMDVANLHVKDGQTRQNGGDSTPGQRQFGNTAKNTETPQAPAPSVQSPPRPSRPDGWDVTV